MVKGLSIDKTLVYFLIETNAQGGEEIVTSLIEGDTIYWRPLILEARFNTTGKDLRCAWLPRAVASQVESMDDGRAKYKVVGGHSQILNPYIEPDQLL